jgi:hypothetical protein
MLYQATHHPYSDTTGPSVGETRTFGSLEAARLWAKSVLPSHASVCDENYHRDMGRMSTVNIHSRYRGDYTDPVYVKISDRHFYCAFVETVTPEITIVPSVGQLGYW